MSDYDNSEFEERLHELNTWQTEQHQKLKLFQEAQRKLLDSEHEKVLKNLKTQNYDFRHEENEKDTLLTAMLGLEDDPETQSKTSNPNYLFNYNSDAIRLKDPRINLCSISQYSQSEKSDEMLDNNNHEETEMSKPRRFLRRGEGLARFRMTINDFKTPPNIYKEKKIKTYLKEKPEFNRKKPQTKTKAVNDGVRRKPPGACSKSKAVPVSIYVSDNKNKNITPPVNSTCDGKAHRMPCCPKSKELPTSKAPVRTLTLKPVLPSNFTRSLTDRTKTGGMSDRSIVKNTIEKEMNKDEKELKMFEMLEGKIDEGSLSPNSSLVAKFMEESLCSTPSKPTNGECEYDIAYSYLESLRALQRQYLTPEQIERIKECDEELSSNCNVKNDDKRGDSPVSSLADLDIIEEDKIDEPHERESNEAESLPKSDNDDKECYMELPKETSTDVTPLLPPKVSKTLIQEYIENFKKLKNEVEEGCQLENGEERNLDNNDLYDINDQILSQREIAIKLQRKALQDNVKTLLNWEGASRKRQQKKMTKKVKSKPVKPEKSRKVEKSYEDKIVLNNGLLKERMLELEKEIEIFKRENRTLTQMQRECEAERSRLEKERKEFEKYIEQEREKFEARVREEQKKLQRDKNVFEKYCKQVKNQPNKKEREEITNLKKELEKLTETMVTKDARWGASQARLRNQIKSLEKDNAELKSEIEKLKKQNAKKVTFESEKNLNTKIIHAINSELGKLKPYLVKPGNAKKNPKQSQTGIVDSKLQKEPMRRIRSVPDLKKNSIKTDDYVEKRLMTHPEGNKLLYVAEELDKSELSGSEFEKKPDSSGKGETPPGKASCGSAADCRVDPEECIDTDNNNKGDTECSPKDVMQTVLREAFFEHGDRGDHNRTNGTVTEIKRRLEKLNLLHNTCNGDGDKNMIMSKDQTECSSEESCGSDEDDVAGDAPNPMDLYGDDQSKCLRGSPTCPIYHCQTKVDCGGIREKTYEDGRKEIFYPNGNIKKISADKRIVKMLYYNGDLKETDITDGSEKYFYAETKTWHTTYRDGLEVLEFPNGQTERRHPDGSTEILFPNGCIRYCDSTGKDEWRFLDGTVIKTDKNGHKVLLLPNGQKEIHTDEYKRREYPDGTVKLLYADGTQETRYATGRVRLKDKDGNLVMDSGGIR